MPLMEQELLILPEKMSSPKVLMGFRMNVVLADLLQTRVKFMTFSHTCSVFNALQLKF
jgi:hypothetical protein